jgi:hypothetical protein
MKESKTPKPRHNKRRLLELQVREYIERYHPDLRDAIVEIHARGTIATVRKLPAPDRED